MRIFSVYPRIRKPTAQGIVAYGGLFFMSQYHVCTPRVASQVLAGFLSFTQQQELVLIIPQNLFLFNDRCVLPIGMTLRRLHNRRESAHFRHNQFVHVEHFLISPLTDIQRCPYRFIRPLLFEEDLISPTALRE